MRADAARSVLPRAERLRFPPGTRSLEVHYTATSLLVPERVRFRTLLEGFDRDWVDAGTRRTAYYNGLPLRTYTFRVRACNDDGVWNETGASLSLTLEPHPWQTRWFLVLEILAAAAVLGAALRAQRHRLERRRLAELRRADLRRKTDELEYARKVQLALLPKGPWRAGPYEVAGETRTATEVGGDDFGYFPAGPGRFAVVVGDATGHGVAAGLVVGMAKAVLSNLRLGARAGGPAEWLRELNGALKASVAQRGLGMCLGLAHVETETGEVRLGIAGVPHSSTGSSRRSRPSAAVAFRPWPRPGRSSTPARRSRRGRLSTTTRRSSSWPGPRGEGVRSPRGRERHPATCFSQRSMPAGESRVVPSPSSMTPFAPR